MYYYITCSICCLVSGICFGFWLRRKWKDYKKSAEKIIDKYEGDDVASNIIHTAFQIAKQREEKRRRSYM